MSGLITPDKFSIWAWGSIASKNISVRKNVELIFRWQFQVGRSFGSSSLGDRDFPDTYNNVSKTVDF